MQPLTEELSINGLKRRLPALALTAMLGGSSVLPAFAGTPFAPAHAINSNIPAPTGCSLVLASGTGAIFETAGVDTDETLSFTVYDSNGNTLHTGGTGWGPGYDRGTHFGITQGQGIQPNNYYVVGIQMESNSQYSEPVYSPVFSSGPGFYVPSSHPQTYRGIYENDTAPSAQTTGNFIVTVSPGQSRSWSCLASNLTGQKITFNGTLDPYGNGSLQYTNGPFKGDYVAFAVDQCNGKLFGYLGNSQWGSVMFGNLTNSVRGVSNPLTGKVNLVIPNMDATGDQYPGGYGYAQGVVSANGSVSWSGKTAAGDSFTSTSVMDSFGQTSVNFSSGPDVVFGYVAMSDGVLQGALHEEVAPNRLSAYPSGWCYNEASYNLGGPYVPPPASRVFPSTSAYVEIDNTDNWISNIGYNGGNAFNQGVIMSNGFVQPSSDLTISLQPAGTVLGTVKRLAHPPPTGTIPASNFSAIVLQQGNGYIMGQVKEAFTGKTRSVFGEGLQ